jgi:hypothetical protein
MSISNLLHDNSYDLYCKSLDAQEISTNTINCTETLANTLLIFNGINNVSLNSSISLKYIINGVTMVFNDTLTLSTVVVGVNTPFLQLRESPYNNNDITGFPEIRGANGTIYSSIIYLYVSGVKTPCIIELTKVSSSIINIKIDKLDGSDFLAIDSVAILPFTLNYISS